MQEVLFDFAVVVTLFGLGTWFGYYLKDFIDDVRILRKLNKEYLSVFSPEKTKQKQECKVIPFKRKG